MKQLISHTRKAGLKILMYPGWLMTCLPDIIDCMGMNTEINEHSGEDLNIACYKMPPKCRQQCIRQHPEQWLRYFLLDGFFDENSVIVKSSVHEVITQQAPIRLRHGSIKKSPARCLISLPFSPDSAPYLRPSIERNSQERLEYSEINNHWRYFTFSTLFNPAHTSKGSVLEIIRQQFRQQSHPPVMPFTHDILYSSLADDRQRRAYAALMWACPGDKILSGPTHRACGQMLFYPNPWFTTLIRDLNHWYKSLNLRQSRLHNGETDNVQRSKIITVTLTTPHDELFIIVVNTSNTDETAFKLYIEDPGEYLEILNTDSVYYGGKNQGNAGKVVSSQKKNNTNHWLTLTVPAFTTLYLLKSTRQRQTAPTS